ncbi:MAG: Ig-like domain-containing protein [Thermoanaerobaculia bacterium]
MRRSAVAVCLFLLSATLSAATFDLSSDRDLLDRADVVVVATVMDAAPRLADDGMILTDYQLHVEDILKGGAPATIVVSEAGGLFNGRGVEIAGSAVYTPGSRVLAFLRQRADGTYYTAFMGLGRYRFAKELLVRDADGIETLGGEPRDARNAVAFLDAIRSGAPSRVPRIAAESRPDPEPRTHAAASAYVLTATLGPKRWEGCESGCTIGFTHNNGLHPVFDTLTGIEKAYAAWTDHLNSFVNLETNNIGADTNWTNDDENDVVVNWNGLNPHNTCEGSKGCGIVYFNAVQHEFRGEDFYTLVAADVLVHQSVTNQVAFESIMTHELGHALAFRHSNEGTPFSTAGVMNSTVPTNTGPTLGAWAEEALTAVYGPGVACVPVTITNTSGAGSVPSGQTRNLSVTVTGDSPRTYQWYEGTSGITTTPVGTNSQNFVTPPITETRNYWVRVSNGCPPAADSATITVTPEVCDEPVITSETASHQITTGSTTNLIFSATGTGPLTYRWYRANVIGDTSNQVSTQASFTTPPLTQTTSYWARVTNSCGQDDTALITVTVSAQCVPPTITSQSPSFTLQQAEGATISVNASGTSPLTYQWYEGEAPDDSNPIEGATGNSFAAGPFEDGGVYKYWVRVSNGCPGSVNSATITITVEVPCPDVVLPLVSAPGVSHFSSGYDVSWTGNPDTATFELQEATDAAFTANLKTFEISDALAHSIPPHLEIAADTRFYYRVRATSTCAEVTTAWSNTASTVVTRPLPADSEQFGFSVPVGATQSFTQDLLVPGFGETARSADSFAIAIDVPWMTVFPASGALSAGGTTVQLTINPVGLEVGTTTGTIQITRTPGAAANGIATHDGPVTTSLPLGLSLVTPVSPDPRDGNPPPGTLIVPAVAHAQGIGSPFRSDVRIVNVSFADIDYEISYTPSQTDGTQTGKKTTITIRAGDVLALDDIVAAWFGAGMLGEGGLGTIEIRPLTSDNPFDTFASSRTYALDAGGTLGQFIPALRANQFIGNIAQDALARISLQQVASSSAYRTNIGFVEGTGAPVSFVARLVDGGNNAIGQISRSLQPYGQFQSSLTNLFGNVELPDGRVEVEVTSPGGKVSAYASVLNNLTNDPLMVFPAQPARTTARRYVLAGIAEFVAPDGRNFHSDMRVYNGGDTPVTITLWYYDRGSSTPHTSAPPALRTLQPGQVLAVDNVLPSLWPNVTGGGEVLITTPEESSLVVTSQTYSRQANGGTKGQFIPGVTFREAVGFGERALEVLQLEQSAQYRSNVGFVEVTGAPATIEVTAFEPDTKSSVVTSIPLQANEYRQFDRILQQLGLGTVYNGRVSVKVITGSGRVYAYGSVVDNRTEDPTYVPAQ